MAKTTYEGFIYQEHIITAIDLIPNEEIKFSLDGEKTNPMIIALTVEFNSAKQLANFIRQVAPYTVPGI